MDRFNLFGDSILKGVQFDTNAGRYTVNDNMGLHQVAAKAGLSMRNFSKFGCTITKAWQYVQRMFTKLDADIVLMNFGSSDCDFDWPAISTNPTATHLPNTNLDEFVDTYNKLIDYVESHRSTPVLATLVPVNEQNYIDHICKVKRLNSSNISTWVQLNRGALTDHQHQYSQAIETVAATRSVPLLDLRSAFTEYKDPDSLLGPDGVHPNNKGQKLIRSCFQVFVDDCLAV